MGVLARRDRDSIGRANQRLATRAHRALGRRPVPIDEARIPRLVEDRDLVDSALDRQHGRRFEDPVALAPDLMADVPRQVQDSSASGSLLLKTLRGETYPETISCVSCH
jgi:hypothetical protein